MLLLIFAPQPAVAQPEVINLGQVLVDMYPQLGASGPNDLIFWNSDELYRFIVEALAHLARTAGVFVTRDTSIVTVLNTGSYSLPANHIATIQADLAGTVLRPRTVHELEALDATWPVTVSTANSPTNSFAQDTQGLQLITVYPMPGTTDQNKHLNLLEHVLPATVSASNAFLAAPTCIREYFTFKALAAARAKETKAAMPEVAGWFGKLAGLMEQAMVGYWGQIQ
jgi:hypothetical protein